MCFGGNVRKRMVWRKVQVSPSAEFLQNLLGSSARVRMGDPSGKEEATGPAAA